jgi:hypothetical protein
MDIRLKSVGVLIDELITTDIKCWFEQEEIMKNAHRPAVQGAAAMKAQQLNARRNQLIRAIDEALGQGDISPTDKTYG